MGISFCLVGIFIATQAFAHDVPSHVHSEGPSIEPLFLVTGYDFENTNVKKVCMMALIDASIHLRNTLTDSWIKVRIPSDSATEGSYCNIDFKSLLVLKFANNIVKISFSRTHDPTRHHGGVASYCTDCNYGLWRIDGMTFTIRHNGMDFHASTVSETMKESLPPSLADGIVLRRSFQCRPDDDDITIPMTVSKVTNLTDGQHMNQYGWTAEIDFAEMHLQPFLVGGPSVIRGYVFSDPVLCKDITASHIVVIFLPLTYFALLMAYNYVKAEYGWTLSKLRKKSRKEDEEKMQEFITSDFPTRPKVQPRRNTVI